MSLETKIDALKASIDALALIISEAQGLRPTIAAAPAPVQFQAAAPAAGTEPVVLQQAAPVPPATVVADETGKIAARNALAQAAQRLGDPKPVVALLAQYIRPGSQPAGTPPNLDHVEPQHYAQLAQAAATLAAQ